MAEYLDRLLVGIEVDNKKFKESVSKAENTFKSMEGRFKQFAASLKDMKIDKQLEKANAALEKTKNAAKNATSELDKMQHLEKVEEMLKGIINEAKKSDDIAMVTQKLKELQSVYKQMTNLGIKNEDAQAVKKYNKALIETKEELKKIADSQKEENKRIEEKEKLQKKLKAISFHEQIAETKKANREYSEQIAALKEVYNRQKQLRTMAENQGNVTQIRKYNDQMDITKQKLKEATEAYEKQNAKIKTNSQRLNSNQKELSQTAVSMRELSFFAVELATLFGLGFGIDDMIRDFTSFSREFDRGIREVFTLTTQTEEEFKGLRNQLVELGKDVPFLYQDLTKAAYWAVSSGVDVGESMMFLEEATRAAMAGVSDLYTSVDALTTVMNAWEMTVDDLADINDTFFMAIKYGKTTFDELAESIGVVAPYAAQTGVAFKEVTTAMAALTRQGLDTKMAATSIARTLGDIIKPSKQAAELAQILGIEYNTTALNAKGLVKFLEDLKGAVGDNMDIITQYDSRLQDTNQALNIFFDRIQSMRGVLALTGSANDEWNKFLEETNKALQESNEEMRVTEIAAKKMEGSIENLENSIKNNYHAIILNNEGLKDLYKGVLSVVNAFLSFNANLEGTTQLVYNLVGGVNALAVTLPVVLGLFKRLSAVLNISPRAGWFMGVTTVLNLIIQGLGTLVNSTRQATNEIEDLNNVSLTKLRDSMEQLNSYLEIMDKDVEGLIKHYDELIYQMEAYNQSAKTGKGNISEIEGSIKDILEMYPELNSFVRTEKGLYVDIKGELDEIKERRIANLDSMKEEAKNLRDVAQTYLKMNQQQFKSLEKLSSFELGNQAFVKSLENMGYDLNKWGNDTKTALMNLSKKITDDLGDIAQGKTLLESMLGSEDEFDKITGQFFNAVKQITGKNDYLFTDFDKMINNLDSMDDEVKAIFKALQKTISENDLKRVFTAFAVSDATGIKGFEYTMERVLGNVGSSYLELLDLSDSVINKLSKVNTIEADLLKYETQVITSEERIKGYEKSITALKNKNKIATEQMIKDYEMAFEKGETLYAKEIAKKLLATENFAKDHKKIYEHINENFIFNEQKVLEQAMENTRKELEEAFNLIDKRKKELIKQGEKSGLSNQEIQAMVTEGINKLKEENNYQILESQYKEFVNRMIEYYQEAYGDLADSIQNGTIVGEGNMESVLNDMEAYQLKIYEIRKEAESFDLSFSTELEKEQNALEDLYQSILNSIRKFENMKNSTLFEEEDINSQRNKIINAVKELYLEAEKEGNKAMSGLASNLFSKYKQVFQEEDVVAALEDVREWAVEKGFKDLEKDILKDLIKLYQDKASIEAENLNEKAYKEYTEKAKEYSNVLTGIVNEEERKNKILQLTNEIEENKALIENVKNEEERNKLIQERINKLKELSYLELGAGTEESISRYKKLTSMWEELEKQITSTNEKLQKDLETPIRDLYNSFLSAYSQELTFAIDELSSQLNSRITSSLTEMQKMIADADINANFAAKIQTPEFQNTYMELLKILEDVSDKTNVIEKTTNNIISENMNLINYYLKQNASLEEMNKLYEQYLNSITQIRNEMVMQGAPYEVEIGGEKKTLEEINSIIEFIKNNINEINKLMNETNQKLEAQKSSLEQEASLFNQVIREIGTAFSDLGIAGEIINKILKETKLDIVSVKNDVGDIIGYTKELSIFGQKFNLDETLKLLKDESGNITFESMISAFKESQDLANSLSKILSGIGGILASWGISQIINESKLLIENFSKAKQTAEEMRNALETATYSKNRTELSKSFSLFGDLDKQEEKISEIEDKIKKLSGDRAIGVGATTGLGAFFGAIIAGPIGALVGAGAGALLGDKATESYQEQIDQLNEDSKKLVEELENLKQKIKEALSIDIESLSSDLASAFDENSYNQFLLNWEKSLKETTQNALLQAFISTSGMQQLLAPISDIIFKMAKDVAEDGVLDDESLEKELTAQGQAVASMMKAFYEILKDLNLDFDFGGVNQEGQVEGGVGSLSTTLTEETGNQLLGVIRTITAHTRDIKNILSRVVTGKDVFHVKVVANGASSNDYSEI
jgi:TP901 family phage tail tape measure protein